MTSLRFAPQTEASQVCLASRCAAQPRRMRTKGTVPLRRAHEMESNALRWRLARSYLASTTRSATEVCPAGYRTLASPRWRVLQYLVTRSPTSRAFFHGCPALRAFPGECRPYGHLALQAHGTRHVLRPSYHLDPVAPGPPWGFRPSCHLPPVDHEHPLEWRPYAHRCLVDHAPLRGSRPCDRHSLGGRVLRAGSAPSARRCLVVPSSRRG